LTAGNARNYALDILIRIERENSYADVLVDGVLTTGSLIGPDRGLLTELVFGVLRRRGTLDHIIGCFSKQKPAKLERKVINLLRLGLYQLFFLDRIPVSAAVNETVNLAKVWAPKASGFVNAVLRTADRERSAIKWPDMTADPAGFLAARHSHPVWLTEMWLKQLGREEAESLAAAMSEPAPLFLRANSLKISRECLVERLLRSGVEASAAACSPFGIHVHSSIAPSAIDGFSEGLFTVQDESSQLAAIFLGPEPGEQVLDLCAAPGGKSTHLAQIMENRGSILACDRDKRKLPRISEAAGRLGITIVGTMQLDASQPLSHLGGRRFDRVMVDAPCSGLGVLRRNPEAKWRLSPEDLSRLAGLQRLILGHAAEALASGGVLVYSTCSTSVEENEGALDDFLSENGDFVIEDLRKVLPRYDNLFTSRGLFRSWPHRGRMDGFFAARLRKLR
jgi:16S rRNA (cytosine967-C5)-methyltransferase